ncbi:PEP-CTERM sorting domain-containing protein [Tolypothrix sp. VBCCA 56010]|uniref:PEP-CTERM sorting domain-containing protein n=1 Tax=Tolypothrix sp. VBCCA 56010 TaxID=3137731 RepID=UPI003D7CB8B2
MMKSLYTAWVFGVTLTLVGFGSSVTKAIAQTTYPFQATYNAEITTKETDIPLVLDTTVRGETSDAPYGLTNLIIRNYSQVDPNTGVATYNSDPATFGLQNVPFGTLTLSGQGNDKLFGTNRGTASLLSGSGTISITGGEGRFRGATGSLDLFQTITSNPDPTGLTAPIISLGTISGSFFVPKTVPEPKTVPMLVGIGVIGAGLVLKRHRRASIV